MNPNILTAYATAKKEFSSYFASPIAYVCIITFLVFVNWIFFRAFFLVGQADVRMMFGMLPWIFLFFVPAVSMGKWAEERKLGTLEFLFTQPVSDFSIVLGKFIGSLGLIAVALILTISIPLTAAALGDVDLGPIIGGYFGSLFLAAAFLSIGLCASALTENQIIAFITGMAVCFAMLIIGTPMVLQGATGVVASIFQYLGLANHFESISRGVIDTRDLVYYLSVAVFFLYVNHLILKTRARR